MRLVVALGGNALLRRGERPDAALQLDNIQTAAKALVPLAQEHELILCHGNGPQVGLLALESAADATLSRPYPLDVLGAQTQGMIGYWLAQCLRNAGVTKPVVGLVTQTLVDGHDASFDAPSKFIGPVYDEPTARELSRRHGWPAKADGQHWRRVVASPEPTGIVELDSILLLVRAQTVVVCGGGGGAPVVRDAAGRLTGVDAVVDKDLTTAALAIATDAEWLLLLTDVPGVMRDFGTPRAARIPQLELGEVGGLTLPAGSMGPKLEGCRRFVAATGRPAGIGALEDAAAILEGTAGTLVTPTPTPTPTAADRRASA